MICIAVYFNKVSMLPCLRTRMNNCRKLLGQFFGLKSPRLIYVESFARVNSLSLSGKLIRPFVDR
jgi:hypothetical protein